MFSVYFVTYVSGLNPHLALTVLANLVDGSFVRRRSEVTRGRKFDAWGHAPRAGRAFERHGEFERRFNAANAVASDCGARKSACYSRPMRDRDRLQDLGNDELLAALSSLVRRGNELTAELLAHLAEFDERRLYLELGFSSLFAYCTEALGFCETTAGRRIAAARVVRKFPEVLAQVARGELHLSALCALGPHVNRENAAELFCLCQGKSRRRVDELLAARFPKPEVRDLIRRLPNPGRISQENEVSRLDSTLARVTDSAQRRVTDGAAKPAQGTAAAGSSVEPEAVRKREPEPLATDRFGVHFTVDAEFLDLLERVRGLARHRLPNGDLMSLMRRGLEAYLRELEKERFGIGGKSRSTRGASSKIGHNTGASGLSDGGMPANRAGGNGAGADCTTRERVHPPGGCGVEPSDVPSDGGESARNKAATEGSSGTTNGHYVSAAVRRQVYVRDERRCTFVSRDGRRCGAREFLEIDHIQPRALGGVATVGNLRLRCRAHNQEYARRCFGKQYIATAIARARRRSRGHSERGDAGKRARAAASAD